MGHLGAWLWASASPGKFIDSFCDPAFVTEDFKGALGAFTPCFIDIVVLGTAFVTAIVMCSLRIAFLRGANRFPKYRLCGVARAIKCSAVVAALGNLLIVAFQMNARIASDASAFVTGTIAPFEWAEYGVGIVTWALFAAAYVVELNRYCPRRTWLLRFPVLFIFAGELAKARFVLLLTERRDYFFYLYVVGVAGQLWLTLLALLHYPDAQHLEPVPGSDEAAYEALNEEPGVCPEATSNMFSLLTFAWVGPLMRLGYKKPLQFEDIWELPEGDKVENITARFEHHWAEEMRKRQPSLTRACWNTTKGLFLVAFPFKLVCDASQFVGPVFLNLLLNVVATGQSSTRGYIYATLMLIGLELGTLADNQHFQRTMRAGYHLRALLVHEVFKKVLYLAPTARGEFSSGRVFNLVTSDAETLQMLCQNIMGLYSSPLRIVVAMGLLYSQLGPASLVALGTLILFMPIQAWMVRVSARLQKEALSFTDERAKLEGELIAGIEVVKCNAWEWSFWDRVQSVREQELSTLWKAFVLQALNSFTLNAIPVLVPVATFAMYLLLGHTLTASAAFTSLSLFTVLRLPLFQLPQLITQLVNARVAMVRLQEYLAAPQEPPAPMLPPAQKGETAIRLAGEFTWDEGAPASLVDIDLAITAGSLVAVVGQTGSGKSSLLGAALGLMKQVQGPPVEVHGKVAYVPQAAFIYNATVRENILFGLPYEEQRYQRAIQGASLGPDLLLLTAGDQTELGDRGVNVSGGQKQRISLARAAYANTDVVLLDDPLSALDARVAREVFNSCLMGELAAKTRVLVTNQLQFVSAADLVIFMAGGQIAEIGTYADMVAAGKAFAQLMSQAEEGQDSKEEDDEEEDGEKPGPERAAKAASATAKAAAEQREAPPPKAKAGDPAAGGTLTEKEGRSTGRISGHVLGVYIRSMGGYFRFSVLMFMFALVEAGRVCATVWLSTWTDTADNPAGAPHPAIWYLAIYAAISGIQVVFQVLSQFLLKALSIASARCMHNTMLRQLLRAPMAFFHTTPLGRIINRLTKDTVDVDKNLADFAAFFLRSLLQLASTIVLIGVVVPFALPALLPILLLFYFLYQYFQASVREVKRLDSISRSPVYSSLGEALAGLPTIRAYRAEDRLAKRNAVLVDASVVMSLVNMSMNRWLSVRLETLGALAAFAAAVLTVEQRGAASTFGLVLSYALTITQLTSITVRLASIAENSFNAVERIDEFCELPQEAPAKIPGAKPDGWPARGKVEFQDVKMRYRPGLPLVLHGLSVTVEPGARCGVVGRTGAGKSSLINTLFRLQELDSGAIVIDGVNIAKMGVEQLRANMAIIPQVPVLFTGTLRFNLTPFGEHSDAECWAALRRAHLAAAAEASPLGLDLVLREGGAPLSAGQKQLVALARALLRHAKILVLDEATANVDVETDALIQKTVRDEFVVCTLISIAHRLHTVIDADAVLVMDRGRAAEYGSPAQLLANPDGVFSGMVGETGEATARFLRSVAAGEVDARDSLARAAAVGLKRLQTPPTPLPPQPVHVSQQLMDKAQRAADMLSGALALLGEDADSAQVRERLGLPPGDGAFGEEESGSAVQRAMQQALALVSDVYGLAAQVRSRVGGGGGGGSNGGANGGLTPRGSRGTPPRLPAVMSGQQLSEQDGDVPNGADTRLRLPGGSGYHRTGSLPTALAGPPGGRRWSVDAADKGDGQADAVRRGARLRGLRLTQGGSPGYQRLADEDPQLRNDPAAQ